ncbi:MAG: hypothetical protein QF652_02530 [Dehalococcoidia bacterium]|jgi:hypothetical protein|nr:hypothetical protein [Dehalococcoidia bacterium]
MWNNPIFKLVLAAVLLTAIGAPYFSFAWPLIKGLFSTPLLGISVAFALLLAIRFGLRLGSRLFTR